MAVSQNKQRRYIQQLWVIALLLIMLVCLAVTIWGKYSWFQNVFLHFF